jgi:4-hydroxybenzoate polyprenyltransferase
MSFGIFYQLLRTARPRQWFKNFAVFAPAVFSGQFFDHKTFVLSVQAFLVFCALSSATYFMNDIIDAPKDRKHPIKKNRPIASGKVSSTFAWIIVCVLLVASFFYATVYIGSYFTVICAFYIALQILYSLKLRDVIILDSLVVASGFIIRVFAGGLASYSSVSSWLVLTTIGLSLLMAFGKRRSEKTILAEFYGSEEKVQTRQTLRHYPDNLLDSMISMSASFCIITYSLFTFQTSPQVLNRELIKLLPSILSSPKWMMLTIPLVIYGVARYLYIIYEKKDAESPERVLLSDAPILFTVMLWILSVFLIVYLTPFIASFLKFGYFG